MYRTIIDTIRAVNESTDLVFRRGKVEIRAKGIFWVIGIVTLLVVLVPMLTPMLGQIFDD